MAAIHSDEFKRDAVRIAQTSGLTRRQVASDLGVGLSTLNKWVKMVSDEAWPPDPDQNLLRENERLRRENRRLKEERELLKKGETISAIGSRSCQWKRHWFEPTGDGRTSSSRPKSREVRVSG